MTASVLLVDLDTENFLVRNGELIESDHVFHPAVPLYPGRIILREQSLLIHFLGCGQLGRFLVDDVIPDIIYIIRQFAFVLGELFAPAEETANARIKEQIAFISDIVYSSTSR